MPKRPSDSVLRHNPVKRLLFEKGYTVRSAAYTLNMNHAELAHRLSSYDDRFDLPAVIEALPQAPAKIQARAKHLS